MKVKSLYEIKKSEYQFLIKKREKEKEKVVERMPHHKTISTHST